MEIDSSQMHIEGQETMDTNLIAVRHIPTIGKEKALSTEGSKALEEVAERGCQISPLRDGINLSGEGPRQPY